MSMPSTRYSLSLRAIHWLTVVAVVAAVILADMDEHEEDGGGATSSVSAMQWHYAAGLAALLLLMPRIVLRVRARVPPIIPTPDRFTALTARLVHLALYAFLLAVPLLGWLQLGYGGEPLTLPWLGWQLPALVQPDPQAKELTEELHEVLGNVLYGLIALHVVAALWHHAVRRDNTLKRML
jgi:cytochrome b561